MNKFTFRGTGVAVVTPFNNNFEVDFIALEKLINYLINNGINYLVALGTTAEASSLTDAEKKEIVAFFKKIINKRVPFVVGMGGNNTAELVNKIKAQDFTDIDGLLSVSPYYNKPTQEGIYQHYKAIAEACPVEVILYNVPGRTASNIEAKTTLRLANDFKNITTIKEASGNFSQIMEIIKNKPNDFHVVSGDDGLTLPLISIGVEGVISVIANALPKDFSEMVGAALNLDMLKARQIHYRLLPFFELIFKEGNPGGVKSILTHKELIRNKLRLPLVPITENLEQEIEKELMKL